MSAKNTKQEKICMAHYRKAKGSNPTSSKILVHAFVTNGSTLPKQISEHMPEAPGILNRSPIEVGTVLAFNKNLCWNG